MLGKLRAEFEKKFEEKARAEKKVFSFGSTAAAPAATIASTPVEAPAVEEYVEETLDFEVTDGETSSKYIADAELRAKLGYNYDKYRKAFE